MPLLLSRKGDVDTANVVSYTPPPPKQNYAAGDYIVVLAWAGNNANDLATATAGWNQSTGAKGTYGTTSLRAFWIKASSTSETMPEITTAVAAEMGAVVVVLTDIAASSPVDIEIHGNSGFSTNEPGSVTGTTGAAGTIGLWLMGCSQWGGGVVEPGAGRLTEDRYIDTSSGNGWSAGWWYEPDSGVTCPSRKVLFTGYTRNYHFITISFKAGTAGIAPPRHDLDSGALADMIIGNHAGNSTGYKQYTSRSMYSEIGTLDGITCLAASIQNNLEGVGVNLFHDVVRITANSGAADRVYMYGLEFNGGAVDCSTKPLYLPVRLDGGNGILRTGTLSQHGMIVGARSGTTTKAYRFWDVCASDTDPLADRLHPFLLDLNDTSNRIGSDVGGTFAPSDTRELVYALYNKSTQSFNAFFDTAYLTNKFRLTGGDASDSRSWVSWRTLKEISDDATMVLVEKMQGAYRCFADVLVGASGLPHCLKTRGEVLYFPAAADFSDTLNIQDQSGAGRTLEFFGDSSDQECHWNDPVVFGAPGTVKIVSGSDSNGVWDWDGGSVTNAGTWELIDVGPITGFTVIGSATLTDVDFDWSGGNNSFLSPSSTYAVSISGATAEAIQAKLDKYANNTLHSIEIVSTFAGDISLNFDNMTITTLGYNSSHSESNLTAVYVNGTTIDATEVADDETVLPLAPIILILQNLPSSSPYWVYNNTDDVLVATGTGDGNDVEIPFTGGAGKSITIRASADGKTRFSTTFNTGVIDIPIAVSLPTNPFRAVSDATALAYDGGTIVGNTSVVWDDELTIQQCYDFCLAWANEAANLQFEIPQSTADGSTFILSGSYAHTVTGANASVAEESKEWSGTFTVASGGFFEDANGAIWEDGSVKRASHFRLNIRNITNEAKAEAAVVSYVETAGGTDQTYSTGLVNGGVLSDANGDVEGYVVWKNGATTYAEHKQQVGEYGFDWSVIPRSITGAAIGPEVVRLIPDAQVTLTKANALAVTGIMVDHSAKVADLSDETNSAAYDNLKARQARVADIEAGKPGYMSFYEAGLLLDYDGNFFNAKADWTYQNVGGTGVWKGGTIELGTPGDIDLDLNATTLDYTAAGTYDHRNETMDGTIVLTNSSGDDVTVQVDAIGVTVDNQGPDITVDASKAIALRAPNIIDGARVRFYNKTKENHLATFVVSGGDGATYNTTFGEGQAVELNDQIDFTACCQIGGASYWPIVSSQTCLGSDMQWDDALEDDDELNELHAETTWTGAGVDRTLNPSTGEILANFADVRISVNDPDNLFDVRKGPLWFCYICTTETGIQVYNPKALRRVPDIRNIVVDGPILVRNDGLDDLYAFGGVWKRADGAKIIAPGGASIQWVPDDRVYTSHIETGISGLDAAESDAILNNIPALTILAAEISKILKNRNITDATASKQIIFADDDETPMLEAPVYEDAAGTVPWTGDGPINRRDKLEAP